MSARPVTVRTQDGWPATIHWRKLGHWILRYDVSHASHRCNQSHPRPTRLRLVLEQMLATEAEEDHAKEASESQLSYIVAFHVSRPQVRMPGRLR